MDQCKDGDCHDREVPTGDDAHLAVPHPPRISDLTDAERNHPLFRRGYSLGYTHRAHEESIAELSQDGVRSTEGGRMAPPRRYGVTSGGLLHRLAPGVRADRDLLAMTDQNFTTQTPCCGREITLLIPHHQTRNPAACCRCHISYQVDLVQEEPDGYCDDPPPFVAVFIVEHLDVAMTRHRAGTWEPAN